MQGFGVCQRCDGVWVTRYCTLVGGEVSEPLRIRLKGGFLVDAEGGPEAARVMDLTRGEESGIHAILQVDPKAAPFRDGQYMLNNNGVGVGVAHAALGGPGYYYRNGAGAVLATSTSSLETSRKSRSGRAMSASSTMAGCWRSPTRRSGRPRGSTAIRTSYCASLTGPTSRCRRMRGVGGRM